MLAIFVAAQHVCRYWQIGRRVRAIGREPWTIIGVVESMKLGVVSSAIEPIMYFPHVQAGEMVTFIRLSAGVLVRTSGDPMAMVPAVRQFANELEPSTHFCRAFRALTGTSPSRFRAARVAG